MSYAAYAGVVRFPTRGGIDGGLSALVRQLYRAASQEEVMAVVSHGVRTLLGADGATFVLRDGDRCFYAEEDAVSPLWKGRRFPMSACVSGWCMEHAQTVAIPDIYKDPRIPADAYRPTFVRSLAMAPVGHEEPIAALGAYWSQVRQPRPDELERLQAIADAAALAVTKLQMSEAPRSRRGRPAARDGRPTGSAARPTLGAWLNQVMRDGLRRNSLPAFAVAVACVVGATLVREGLRLSGLPGLVTYSTFYPAVVLSVLAGGAWCGALATGLGAVAVYWFFTPPIYEIAPLTPSDVVNLAIYLASCTLIILVIERYKHAVLRLRQEDARHFTLAREQRHRLKNAIAVVEAIVKQTLRDQPERAQTIQRRVRAGLSNVEFQDPSSQAPISVRDLLVAELQAHDLARFDLEGGDEMLPPKARDLVALAVHELVTNALKYGSLSVPMGRVKVSWIAADGQMTIRWRETGGPPVTRPQKQGYGSIMLSRLVEASAGAITLAFGSAGVTAELSLALTPSR